MVSTLIGSRKTGNPEDAKRLPDILETMADMYKLTSEFDKSIKKYETAKDLVEEPETVARLFRKIGFVHDRTRETENALQAFDQGLELAEEEGHEAGRILVGKGIAHWRKGDFDKAEDYCRRSLDIFNRLDLAFEDIGFAHNLLGNIID